MGISMIVQILDRFYKVVARLYQEKILNMSHEGRTFEYHLKNLRMFRFGDPGPLFWVQWRVQIECDWDNIQ